MSAVLAGRGDAGSARVPLRLRDAGRSPLVARARRRRRRGRRPPRHPGHGLDRGAVRDRRGVGRRRRPRRAALAARRTAPDREPRGDRRGRGCGARAAADDRSAAAARVSGAARRDRRGDATARAGPRSRGAVSVHGCAEGCPGNDSTSCSRRSAAPTACRSPRDDSSQGWAGRLRYAPGMESGGFFPFGGDPEEILRGLREFAETQSESVKEAQREQFATLTLSTAVELTAAALKQVQPTGWPEEQAGALRDAMRILFPEAVALVSAARQGFMRESLRRRALHVVAQADRTGEAAILVSLFDRAVASVLPGRPTLGRPARLGALHRRPHARRCPTRVCEPERRREARNRRRPRRGDHTPKTRRGRSPRRTATCWPRSRQIDSTRTSPSSSPGSG